MEVELVGLHSKLRRIEPFTHSLPAHHQKMGQSQRERLKMFEKRVDRFRGDNMTSHSLSWYHQIKRNDSSQKRASFAPSYLRHLNSTTHFPPSERTLLWLLHQVHLLHSPQHDRLAKKAVRDPQRRYLVSMSSPERNTSSKRVYTL